MHAVAQCSGAAASVLLYSDDAALVTNDPGQPGNWTDYRVTAILDSSDTGALGLLVRYIDENTYYRFSLDRQKGYRRFESVVFGITTVLAQDDFIYQENCEAG